MNPNPHLFENEGRPTPGRLDLQRVRALVEGNPELGGIYFDSITGWSTRHLNFRREHFRYERLPLTYDEATGRVAIQGVLSTLQFLRSAGDLLHGYGKLLFANLGPRRFFWLYSAVDVCGVEGAFRHFDAAHWNFFRTAAFQKPVLLLDYLHIWGKETPLARREGMERYFRYALLYGMFPSIGRYPDRAYREHRDLYDTYLPLLRRLFQAGWQPVPGATFGHPSVRLERFGPKGGKGYLTLLNEAEETVIADLSLDLSVWGWTQLHRLHLWPVSRSLPPRSRITLALRPGEAMVMEMEGK